MITALNALYQTGLSEEVLCGIGASIGADVPFCITGGTLLAQGIGEVLSQVKPLRRCHILLAKPEFGVSTGAAFTQFDREGKAYSPDCLGMLCAVQRRDLAEIASRCDNVFEQFIEVPTRIDMKEIMKQNGALGACMSGSGPTVFGIFERKEDALRAAAELQPYARDILVTVPVRQGCKMTVTDE